MALPALLVPIVMTGARQVIKKAAKDAAKLVKAGKAKYAKDVEKEIGEGISRIVRSGKVLLNLIFQVLHKEKLNVNLKQR